MKGKLVNLDDDVEDKPITVKEMKLLKNIATCDRVATRELFKQSQDDVLTTSLMFTSNFLLKTHEKGDAYKRRVLWAPMFNVVPKADPRFISKLTTDEAKEYWLKLIIDAYYRLYEKAEVTESTKVKSYTEGYHEENKNCIEFVKQFDKEHFIEKRPPTIYDEYVIWAEENIGKEKALSDKLLKQTVKDVHGLVMVLSNGKVSKVYKEDE